MIILPPVVYGWYRFNSLNFDPLANTDNGSCIAIIYGCMDPTATNYNASATVDNGSCAGYATANIIEDTINTCNSFTSISAQLVSNSSYVWSTQLSTPLSNFQQLIDQGYAIESLLSGGMPIDSAIGLTYQGGVIFYVDNLNHLLYIAAPADITIPNGCPGYVSGNPYYGGTGYTWWSFYDPVNGFSHVNTGAIATNIGSGQSNTNLAVSAGSGAAPACSNQRWQDTLIGFCLLRMN